LYIKSGCRIKAECLCTACISGYYLPPASSRSIVHDIFTLHETVYVNRAWICARIKTNIPEKMLISFNYQLSTGERGKRNLEGLSNFSVVA